MVILAPFEAFKIGLVSPKTLFGQGSLGILKWSTIGIIGHVGCDIHYSHDGHYGFVSHDCHEAIKVIIDLRPSRLKKKVGKNVPEITIFFSLNFYLYAFHIYILHLQFSFVLHYSLLIFDNNFFA